jgi:hypothetical protein
MKKNSHEKNTHMSIGYANCVFDKSCDKKEKNLQVNWRPTFVFVMAWHAMLYNKSPSNMTSYIMHASHIMIFHAQMHNIHGMYW